MWLNPFKKTYSNKEKEVFEFLSEVKLFEKLNNEELHEFVPFLHERVYQNNEVVFFRGDPSHALYLIKGGKITLNVDLKNDFESLVTLSAGKAFGENSLIANTKRIYSALVETEDAHLVVIPQLNIHEIFQNNVRIKAKMLESLAEINNEYNDRLYLSYRSSVGFFNLGQAYQQE